MKHKDEEKVQSSLIPGIRQQEGHLQEALEGVQEEAGKMLEQARQESKQAIDKAREDFSASVDRLREAGLEQIRLELEAEEAGNQASIQQFQASTEARIPGAVKLIMKLVMPEGKA
ncbi:MAG: hypothetical protein K9N55_12995 [Phycisphaerae bacterium]|nr:hypothetical protein [Phycisphaerae bacterium]